MKLILNRLVWFNPNYKSRKMQNSKGKDRKTEELLTFAFGIIRCNGKIIHEL